MKHSKTLKEIRIEGHIRKTPKGGATTVDPHFAKREVNIEDKILETFQGKAKELRTKLFGSDGNLKGDGDSAVHEIINNLYLTKGNGVDNADLNISPYAISEILSQTSKKFFGFEDMDLKKSMDIHGLALLLTNPEFIKMTHERSKNIKDKMNSDGLKTGDWIDPFSFTVNQEVKKEIGLKGVRSLLYEKKIHDGIITMSAKHKDILGPGWIDEDPIERKIFNSLRLGLNKNRKFTSSILPSIILPHITESSVMFKDTKNFMNLQSHEKPTGNNELKRLFKNEIDEKGFIFGNTPDVRKKALDFIGKVKDRINKGDELYKFLNATDDANFTTALNHIVETGFAPLYMHTEAGTKLLKDVQRLSERIRGVTDGGLNTTKKVNVSISKNPISILTMSPRKTVVSCQTLTDLNGTKIHLTDLNANVVAAVNTHRTNDFIMFKNNNKGEKGARLSMSIDSYNDKFKTFETEPIYGSDKDGRESLDLFLYDMKNKDSWNNEFRWITNEPVNISKELQKTTDPIKTMSIAYKEITEDPKSAEHQKEKIDNIQSLEREVEAVNNFKVELQNLAARNLKESGESMLYGAQMADFLTEADQISIYKTKIQPTTIAQQSLKKMIMEK